MNQVAKVETRGEIMEQVLIRGDLAKLSVEERGQYYNAVCSSVGLNPLTKPFEYITLNGKLRLYALKDCTDQLRSIHGISVTELVESEREGVFIVKAKVANAAGRTDVSTGAVTISNLKGEALANALMKAETKAKRRATLSICGLGMLDETEVEDIPTSQKAPVPSPTVTTIKPTELPKPAPIVEYRGDSVPHKIVGGTFQSWADTYIAAVQSAGDPSVVMKWIDVNTDQLEKLGFGSPEDLARARTAAAKHLEFLRKTAPKATEEPVQQSVPQEDKKPRGRLKAAPKAPDMAKDYDGWMSWNLRRIAEAETPDAIEMIFEELDAAWDNLLPPDKEALLAGRREAEDRFSE